MKNKLMKINRYHIISFLFILFIFIIFTTTIGNGLTYKKDEIKEIYSAYINGDYSYVNKAKSAILTGKETLQTLDSVIPRKNDMINAYGLVQKALGRRYINDAADSSKDIVKLKNGQITFIVNKNDELIEKSINNATDFSRYLETKGIDYLFIQAPHKINPKNNLLPAGVKDYSNANADAFLKGIEANGVNTFDLRDEMDNQDLDHYSMFFNTDHHWKPAAGLWAAREICKKLNSNFGFSIDTSVLDSDKFTSTVYKDAFLGSEGKRIGKYYAGVDDIELLIPKYETSLTNYIVKKNGAQLTRKGSFENTLISKVNLEPVDYYNKNPYAAYTGGDYPLEVIINKSINGKKIVFFRDSFSCVVTPFLSLAACNELHIIDPRYYKGSVRDYIDKVNPDIVISLHNPDYWEAYFAFN